MHARRTRSHEDATRALKGSVSAGNRHEEFLEILLKERQACSEAVEEIPPAYRADLAGGKKTSERDFTELPSNGSSVVIGHLEELAPAPITAKKESSQGVGARSTGLAEQNLEILARGLRISQVKLNRHSWLDQIRHEDGSFFTKEADDVSNQKVATAVLPLAGIDRETKVEPALEHRPLDEGQFANLLSKLFERWTAPQLENAVAVRLGDHEVLPKGAAALRNKRPHTDSSRNHQRNSAVLEHLMVEEKAILARSACPARHASQELKLRIVFRHSLKQAVGGE